MRIIDLITYLPFLLLECETCISASTPPQPTAFPQTWLGRVVSVARNRIDGESACFYTQEYFLAILEREREEESYIVNRVSLLLSSRTDDIRDAAA